jgi:hypothetical protein
MSTFTKAAPRIMTATVLRDCSRIRTFGLFRPGQLPLGDLMCLYKLEVRGVTRYLTGAVRPPGEQAISQRAQPAFRITAGVAVPGGKPSDTEGKPSAESGRRQTVTILVGIVSRLRSSPAAAASTSPRTAAHTPGSWF